MKTLLRTSLSIALMLVTAGCALPSVTPEATPSTQGQPTSTAPAAAGSPTPGATAITAGAPISAANAVQISAAARTAVSNPQQLVWSLDSGSLSVVSQNSSDQSTQVFSDALLEVPSLAPIQVYAAPAGTQRLAASPDGKTAAVLDLNGEQLDLVNVQNKTVMRTLDPGFPVGAVTFSLDGNLLSLTDTNQPDTALFDAALGAQTATLSGFGPSSASYTAGFFGSSSAIVWQSGTLLMVQDITTQTMSLPFELEDTPGSFMLTADGSILAAAAPATIEGVLTPAVSLWNVSSSSLLGTLALSSPAVSLAFSPDGSLLAVGTADQIEVWDVESQSMITTLKDAPAAIYLLAFSPDGRWLASAYADQLVLWSVPGE